MGELQEIPGLLMKDLVAWREPAALMLDERGLICDCSDSSEELFGYSRQELIWQHVSKLLPQLSDVELVQDGRLNPRISFLCHCGRLFRAQNRQGNVFSSELKFVSTDHAGKQILRLLVQPYGNLHT
jgi:PAS domain S-box-containing protein